MARSTDINQRIVLSGADEVRRHLDEIAQAGQRSGNQTRAALLAATGSLDSFSGATEKAAAAHGGFSAQAQAASHSLRSMTEQVILGAPPLTILTQQMGHLSFAASGAGGLKAAFSEVGGALAGLLTPTTAAVAGVAALVAGVAFFVARAAESENSAKQFDVILKATGQSSRTTGAALEAAAEKLHDVGLSASEAREAFKKFITQGGFADQAPKIVRIGAELNKVLGEGSMEKFISAAASGGAPLEEIARQLGIVVVNATETAKELDAARAATHRFNESINDAIRNQNKSLKDLARDNKRQLEDIALQQERQKRIAARGPLTAAQQVAQQEEDIARQSGRRIEDIHRQTNDAINALILQRNQQNAAALATYNQQIEAAAQAAADKQSLIAQIGEKVLGSFRGTLTPTQEAVLALSTAWNELADTISKSGFIQQILLDLTEMIKSIASVIKWLGDLAAAIRQIPGLPVSLGGSGEPTQNRAAGGLVLGPGSGTSDSIPARLSNGEFVVNALATRMNLPILEAINAMRMPIMPRMRMPRGFAMGGLVTAGGGNAPVHIHLGGGSFPLMGDRGVVDALTRAARKSAMLSAGRKPSTA